MSKENENQAHELFTVHAFRDGKRDEHAERLAMKQGFVPAEKERAESAAQRCNQLSLIGVEFKAVPAEEASTEQAEKGAVS